MLHGRVNVGSVTFVRLRVPVCNKLWCIVNAHSRPRSCGSSSPSVVVFTFLLLLRFDVLFSVECDLVPRCINAT